MKISIVLIRTNFYQIKVVATTKKSCQFLNDDKNCDKTIEINHNPNWYYNLDYPHKILITCNSGSGKTNVLLNLMERQQPNVGKINL